MPLAAITIVFPVFGPRVLRWVIVAPRTYVRLLLALLIDLILFAGFIVLGVLPLDDTSSSVVIVCLLAVTSVLHVLFPTFRASGAFVREVNAFIRSKDRSLKAVFRYHRKNILEYADCVFRVLFYFLISYQIFGILGGPPAVYFVLIVLFFLYRFFTSWLVYRGLARN